MKRVQFSSPYLPYLFLAPQMAIIFVFFYWPSVQAIQSSFYLEDPFGFGATFVGLSNYSDALGSVQYQSIARFTVVFTALVTFLSLGIGMLLGLLLSATAGIDRVTAYFCAVPGGPAEMGALGEQHGANSAMISMSQLSRVVLLVLIIPPFLTFGGFRGHMTGPVTTMSVDYAGLAATLSEPALRSPPPRLPALRAVPQRRADLPSRRQRGPRNNPRAPAPARAARASLPGLHATATRRSRRRPPP